MQRCGHSSSFVVIDCPYKRASFLVIPSFSVLVFSPLSLVSRITKFASICILCSLAPSSLSSLALSFLLSYLSRACRVSSWIHSLTSPPSAAAPSALQLLKLHLFATAPLPSTCCHPCPVFNPFPHPYRPLIYPHPPPTPPAASQVPEALAEA